MNFLDKDFEHLEQNDAEFQKNFQSCSNACERNTFLYHTLQYLIYVKDQINSLPPNSNGITPDNLKQIRPGDASTVLSKRVAIKYQEMVDKKRPGQVLDDGDIFMLIFSTFKSQLLSVVVLFHIDVLLRLTFSVLILHLFEEVAMNNDRAAYIYVAILTVVWYLSQLFKELGLNTSYLLSNNIKSAFAMLLFAKLSKMTFYSINTSEHRNKITNLIANDLTVLQQRTAVLLQISVFPAMIIGVTILLYIRVGWSCFIGMAIVLLIVPVIIKISAINADILRGVNGAKDKRTEITTQIVQEIKNIKMNGWELAFQKLVKTARTEQVDNFKKLAFGRSVQRAIGNSITFISALVMFIIANATTDLTTPRIFSVMEMKGIIKASVLYIVLGIGLYYESKVVLGRFAIIFNIQDKKMINLDKQPRKPIQPAFNSAMSVDKMVSHQESEERFQGMEDLVQSKRAIEFSSHYDSNVQVKNGTVVFTNFNGFWKKQPQNPVIKKISYKFDSPKLYGITGKVSSGKSSLLEAIIGEIPYYSGKITVKGTISYVEQEPVILSESIRSNILFGRPFNRELYQKAIKVSCLASDFEQLIMKDHTVIGQKGVNLSGGEKIRLALARAVYSEADIYLFDNPFSAVDYKIAKKMFSRCIEPLSKKSLVILVTHRTAILNSCDEILIMDDGKIIQAGRPSEIQLRISDSLSNIRTTKTIDEDLEEEKPLGLIMMKKRHTAQESNYQYDQVEQNPNDIKKILEKNENATNVDCSTYSRFFFSDKLNYLLLPIGLILLFASQILVLVFLRLLADFKNVKAGTSGNFQGDFALFWGILGLLVLMNPIVLTIKYYLINMALVISATKIHENMVTSFLRIPTSFYDETASGVLINKFTTDLGVLDNSLVVALIDGVEGPILIGIAIFNMIHIDSYFAIPASVLAVVVVAFFLYSRKAFIACKQLDLASKGPIFHFYNQTIYGLTQMRLFNRRKAKMEEFSRVVDKAIKASIGFDMVSRGFGFYEAIAAMFLMTTGMMLGVQVMHPSNSGEYGVVSLYFIVVCQSMQWILRQTISVESYLVSAQRILQFELFGREKDLRTDYDKSIGLIQEVESAAKDQIQHVQWPQKAQIQMQNLSLQYDSSNPSILKNISFKIKQGEKVAIVGRSGAGKSSIVMALFRMVQPYAGCIYKLGGHNALQMGLHSIRRHISFISQHPFVFRGTVKDNLDPTGRVSEQTLWKVLQETNLKLLIDSLPKKLQTELSNKEDSLSMGQKQLLCLARVLLNNNKFLILDEATANLDEESDNFIQKVIRQRFKKMTMITVAHRLNTVADYDRVIVMSRGTIVEEGTPYELIQNRGVFYDMVKNSGKEQSQAIIGSVKELFKSRSKVQ